MLRTILVVDDDAVSRKLLYKILSDRYNVLEAGNGKEAMAILAKDYKHISAILLDLVMPVMDGFAVLEQRRKNPVLSQIPVLVITGSTELAAEERALDLGAADFITKPYHASIIFLRINNIIKLRENAANTNTYQRDRLTGLWRRDTFFEKAAGCIERKPAGYYFLSSVDIDNFKVINEQFGDARGDEVLKALAKVISDECEENDGLCGRISADNFIVLYPRDRMEAGEAERRKYHEVFLPGTVASVVVSIGRYAVEDKSLPVSAMYNRAKMAQKTVKGRSDMHVALYDDSMRKKLLREQEIVRSMHTALQRGEFEAWFQPQINHATGAFIGAEVLPRWRHGAQGYIAPEEFLPLFEKNGFIYELDKYIWKQACAFLRLWLDNGNAPLSVSVNIGAGDLFRSDLMETLTSLLERYEIPAALLRLEIAEDAFAQSALAAAQIGRRLIDQGFTLEIDNFGSGYASFSTLKAAPAQILKLDMRLLSGKENTDRGGNIIESIVRMAKWLGMSVIAVGVETVAQADYLKSIGCVYVQGDLYAPFLPADEYEAMATEACKESQLARLQTVENLDNLSFWNPESVDTLIFNSFVGAACIFEYAGGRVELIRATDKYTEVIGNAGLSVQDALALDWDAHLDEENRRVLAEAVRLSIDTKDEVTSEYVFLNLPGCPEKTYLRSTLRVIASAGDRRLIYCTNENMTAQREAEREKREQDEQIRFLNDVAGDLLAQPETESSIDRVLHKIRDHFGADRAYVFEMNRDDMTSSNTYEVCAPGVTAEIGNLQNVPYESMAFWWTSFEKGSYIEIAEVAGIDESRAAEREILEAQHIRSLAAVPFSRDGVLIGFIGVDNLTRQQGHVEQLRALGDYLTVMLTRRDLMARIEDDKRTLQTLMDDTPGGFMRLHMQKNGAIVPVFVNNGFCKMIGMTSEEVLSDGGGTLSRIHPDDRGLLHSSIGVALRTGKTANLKYRLRNGAGVYVWFSIFARITQDEEGDSFLNIYYTDLTESEKHDLTLRETMPFILSAIMRSSTDLTFAKDKDFNYICCSPAFARFAGQEEESGVVGKSDFELFSNETAEQFRRDDLALFETGESLIDYLEPIPSSDDVQHYSSTSKYILRDSAGAIIGLYGVGRDVTDIRSAFDRLKMITDNIPGGIASYVCANGVMKPSYYNDGFCHLLGYTREEYKEAGGNAVMSLLCAEDKQKLQDAIAVVLRDGTPLNCTCRIHNRSGDGYKWVNFRGGVTERYGDTAYANLMITDVSELKTVEEALRTHEEEIKLALSKMNRVIAEYDIKTRTLTLPDLYAQKYGFPQVVKDMPEGMRTLGGMSDESFALYRDFYNAIGRSGTPAPIEVQKHTRDGAAHWERMSAYTVFDDAGKPVKALVVADNTTEQHVKYELERNRPTLGEKNMLFRALFDLTTRETLEYYDKDERPVVLGEQIFSPCTGKKNAANFVDKDEYERFRALHDIDGLLEAFDKGNTEFSIDFRRVLPNGEALWARNVLHMMQKPDSEDVLLFEYSYNVEEEKFRELTNHVLLVSNYDAVVRVNLNDGRFTVVTDAKNLTPGAARRSGGDYDADVCARIEANIHPDDRTMTIGNSTVAAIARNLADREQFQFTCRELAPDGTVANKKITQCYLDRSLGIALIAREDITQIMAEENEKNRVLADALEAANLASRAKTSFLSRMSHELRTPMNAIIGLSALSATELDDRKRMEDNIGKIGMSARYLLSLINDILEMSRIESGRMTLSEAPFDFEQFISGVNALIHAQAEAKGVDYDVVINNYTEAVYVGDATKLQEILVNVLGNAVKFTPEGGKVILEIEQLNRIKNCADLRFIVKDTGVGIDEAFLPRMFEPFSQESASFTSTSTGTGLGLAITKNLVEMMNGQIQVNSIKGMGSVFTVDVQLGVSDESQRYHEMVASMHLDNLRALVVDDDVIVCRSTEKVLVAMGIQAEWVDSGKNAVARVQEVHVEKHDYDAIFVDWKMPDMDGIETTRRIRKIVGPDVTIVIMTAYDWRAIEEEAREAGVDLFIEKPLFQSSIMKAFEKVFTETKGKLLRTPPERPDFTGRHILLAEDHPLNVEVAKRLLEKVGAEVTVAGNGIEAIEIFATAPDNYFDAILMDIRMPEMDGLTATKSIRKLKKAGSATVPILAMTANAFDEDAELSLRSGMNAHLAKPIEPQKMFDVLRRFMK